MFKSNEVMFYLSEKVELFELTLSRKFSKFFETFIQDCFTFTISSFPSELFQFIKS